MKKKTIITLWLSVMLIGISSTGFALETSTGGESSILIERDSGRVLYSNQPNKKLPMASTTKVMTALLAIEYGDLNEKIKISNSWTGIEGSSIYLKPGEEITLEDLVYGLMLRSGNDAAVAIACHISGSVEGFAELMNKRAKEIGAVHTNFVNPHGLHDNNHYTTAYDLALITREALKNSKFRDVVKCKLWVADRKTNQYFYNKNKTLWQYESGDGVKIGYTQKAGRCLVASATRNNMQLIAVVLNNNNWFNDCYHLFDYGFSSYQSTIIFDKHQFIKKINIENGKKNTISLITSEKFVMPLTAKEKEHIKIKVDLPNSANAPIRKGQKLGTINVYMEGVLLYTTNLITSEDVFEKNIFEKVYDYFKKIGD